MAQGKRDRLSTEQRIEMWRRWKAGESLHEIGRAFGKGHGSISGYSQADLNKVALRLNQRPRQTLGFQTPASKTSRWCCIDQLSRHTF
jgi:IS30 family transposase